MYTANTAGTAILFEMVMQQMLGNFLIRTHWIPRLNNQWADDLSKGLTAEFAASREIKIEAKLPFAKWFWNMSQGQVDPLPSAPPLFIE